MGSSLDTTGLFIDQVRQHADALIEVLSNGRNGECGADDLMDRSIRSTRMIAGSSLIMGLDMWHQCLSELDELLSRYRDLPLQWDERIAQVVSEMIEKEELLVSAKDAGDIMDLASVVGDEEVQALIEEIRVVQDSQPDVCAREDAEETVPEPESRSISAGENCQSTPAWRPQDEQPPSELDENATQSTGTAWINPSVVDTQSPLALSRVALERIVGSLNRALSDGGWAAAADKNVKSHDIHRNLCMIDFFSHSMREILDLREQIKKDPILTTLEPIQSTLADYAGVLCNEHGRRVTVGFTGTENKIDANLLFDVGQVLRFLVRDVVVRCDDPELHIQVEVTEKNGALWWEVKDNGNNFIKDSKFDRDECLAFYPSLKQVRKTLEGLNSILWVEPEDNEQTRFVFTTRVNREHERFVVWGEGDNSIGALSTQFCSVLSPDTDDVSIESDSRGEHVVVNDRKVPLVRLQLIYSDAPDAGDKIAVMGSLENKVAIYVNGDERVEEGIWRKDMVSTRKGLPRGVAEMDENRVPIIEASDLLVRYLNTSGEAVEDGVSGGVAGDGNDLLPESQATYKEEASSPPAFKKEVEEEVLVVEQSKAVIETFESIISSAKFNMKIVESVEDALTIIRQEAPRLIISEFRMPTLAAQRIKDALLAEGKNVPIVVTTSQTGTNADLLVKKLGVSDYLSKPLRAEAVSAKIDHYLNRSGISNS